MPSRIALLVTGRARSYLRTSTTLFCLSLCLLGTYLVLVESQHVQRQGSFTENPTVHLIQVSGPAKTGGEQYLRFNDVTRIEAELSDRHPGADVTAVYSLGFGMPDADGEPRFVYGLDGEGARLLGLPAMEEGVAYSTRAGSTSLALDVPVVEVTDGGFTSRSTVRRELVAAGGVTPDNPLSVLGDGDPAAVYVAGDTFRGLVSDAFGTEWESFRAQYDRDNVYGAQVVDSLYVHVPVLDDVEVVAASLDQAGYATRYTLEAFDDLAGSLSESARLGLAAVVAALLGCLAYVLLSISSYLRVSHKDMAILRHAGFTAGQVAGIYRTRVVRVFVVIAGVTSAYQLVVGGVVLRADALRWVTVNVALTTGLLILLAAYVVRDLVPRHTSLDVLTLLKADRQFE